MHPRSVLSVLTLLLIALLAPFGPSAHADAPSATFTKTSDWGSGWEARFTLTNGSGAAINGWRVEFDLPAGTSVGTYWDALLTTDGQHQTFRNREYNGTIPAGGSVSFGFIGNGPGSPENCTFNGAPCTGDPGGPGGPGEPGELGAPGSPAVTARTDTSLTLSWTAATGDPTGYRIYEGSDLRATVGGTTATLSGLAPCSTHSYTIRAYNDDGESPAATVSGTTTGCTSSPLPRRFLTGYWHDFVNEAGALRLSEVPDEYDLIAVAFGEATARPGEVTFRVDPELSDALGGYGDAQFKADLAALQAAGKKVILSVGGERGAIRVSDAASAQRFTDSVHALMTEYGFDGVDIDLEHGIDATYMEQALRQLRDLAGPDLIITMAPQTIDFQAPSYAYYQLALGIQDILTIVNMQYYNSGSMLGCDQQVYAQGTVDFLTAQACIQLQAGLDPDQVGLGLPAVPSAAGGGYQPADNVTAALDCLATASRCGAFVPNQPWGPIGGAMTWSVNWDATNGFEFANVVGSYLGTG